jgi:hypothetical protein
MQCEVAAAGGALLVAALNELRAQLRAKQADRDRQERLVDAVRKSTHEHMSGNAPGS